MKKKKKKKKREDTGSVPAWGRSPEVGNDNPLLYSDLENSMDRGTWWADYSPWGQKKWDTNENPYKWFQALQTSCQALEISEETTEWFMCSG